MMMMRKAAVARQVTAMAVQAPTSAQVANIVPELTDKWSRATLMSLERLEHAIRDDNGLAAKYWATAAGIGTDKIMPLKGMPTTIVSNVHQHRHDLSPLMDRLAIAARVVQTHQRKGYLTTNAPIAGGRVIDLDLDSVNITHSAEPVDAAFVPGDTVRSEENFR